MGGKLERMMTNAERIMAGKNARIAELEAEVERLRAALDMLGLALVHHDHQWTDEERALYERATTARRALHRDAFITDGFGSYWPSKCPDCGAPMQVVRPGDCRCSAECYTIDDTTCEGNRHG